MDLSGYYSSFAVADQFILILQDVYNIYNQYYRFL